MIKNILFDIDGTIINNGYGQIMPDWNQKIINDYWPIFPEIEETLKKLKKLNIKTGIVTSSTNQELRNYFDYLNLNQYFDVEINAMHTEHHKPSPEPIQKAINMLKITTKETIYIGDSVTDMQSAHKSHVYFGLAKWGTINPNLFTEADIILERPQNILKILNKF